MSKVTFNRIESSSSINDYPVEDGNFWITGDGKTYVDYDDQRISIAGTPDTQMSDISRNTVENNVIKEYVDDKTSESVERFGKLLWEGEFSTGSITVPNLSDYILIAVNVSGVMCIGSQKYGGCVFTTYQQLTTSTYGYRYTYNENSNTLTVDSNNTGATNGSTRQSVTQIFGIF